MNSLYSFSDNWMDLSVTNPKEFVEEVERRHVLPEDFKRFISLIKDGSKADRKLATKRSPWNVGDWIVQPYSPYLVQVLRKAIERGRLRER
jgi:macrodomain Ter protein organizer (MatP/YcbG family)